MSSHVAARGSCEHRSAGLTLGETQRAGWVSRFQSLPNRLSPLLLLVPRHTIYRGRGSQARSLSNRHDYESLFRAFATSRNGKPKRLKSPARQYF